MAIWVRSMARMCIPPTVALLVCVAVWWILVVASQLPTFVLPSPYDVAIALQADAEALGKALLETSLAVLVGLSIAVALGVVLAILMDWMTLLRRALYPLLVTSQTIQILAIAPLLIIWFGFGLTPKVMVVTLFAFFPLTISMVRGLLTVDPEYMALLRSFQASRSQIWRLTRLPAALPSLFAGLRLSVSYSVVAATIGEWIGGSGGIGLYMLRAKNALKTDRVFAAMLIATALSILLFLVVATLEWILLPWRRTQLRTSLWDV